MKPLYPLSLLFLFAGSLAAVELSQVAQYSGLVRPESVVFDASRDVYYVSVMGPGGQENEPGNGGIARLSSDLSDGDPMWVTGLNDPKGIVLARGKLYATDVTEIVEVDLDRGVVTNRWRIPNPDAYLNDIAADVYGNIFVCDSAVASIYRLNGDTLEVFFVSDRATLGRVNGLKVQGAFLLASGAMFEPDGKRVYAPLHTIKLDSRELGAKYEGKPLVDVDAIEPARGNSYFLSDWPNGKVLYVQGRGKVTELLSPGRGTADLTYLRGKELVIVPQMLEGTVTAYKVTW